MAIPLPSRGSKGDATLVAEAIGGDAHALTAIYRRHASHVAGVVYRLLGSDADLDDIVQETFVDGLRQLSALREPEKLQGYLVTIAVRRIHARLSFRYRMKALARELFGTSPEVGDAKAREEVHSLYGALRRVPPRHRIAWGLHRIEGYTLPEVAAQTEASLASVKRWIADVDRKLEEDNEAR